jgi:predicted SAM-dependent methyltransferase
MKFPDNAELVKQDPLQGLVRSPSGLVARWRHYSQRYGYMHAIAGYLGRYSHGLWQVIGPIVTRPYLKCWLASTQFKILNLGGGNVLFDRWLTADVVPRADVHMSVTKPLPVPSESVDVVYSEEVIEHVSLEQGKTMLQECFRILKPGGWLRLTTPSLDYFARKALESVDCVGQINDIFYKHEHCHIYTEAELQDLVARIGFVELRPSSYRDPAARFGYLDSHPVRHKFAPPEWSQYLEARKPAATV